MTKTMRRDVLKRLAVAGNLVYCGGYSFDDTFGEDRSDHREKPLPCEYIEERGKYAPPGTVTLKPHHFDHGIRVTESTLANGLRLIHVRYHSNSYSEFYRKDEFAAYAAKKAAEKAAEAAEKPVAV